MQNAFEPARKGRRGSAVVRVVLGAYFLAFGAGVIPGKDVTVITAHLIDSPFDAILAGVLLCPIAFLVLIGRMYRPALLALIAAFVAVTQPVMPDLPPDFTQAVWSDAAMLAAMGFAVFLSPRLRDELRYSERKEPTAPSTITDLASPIPSARILGQPTIRVRRAPAEDPPREGLNIFREEFVTR